MPDKKEIDLSLVDITIDANDFAVDKDGTIRIANKRLARRVKAAIEDAKRYPSGSIVKGKMVIPIET